MQPKLVKILDFLQKYRPFSQKHLQMIDDEI